MARGAASVSSAHRGSNVGSLRTDREMATPKTSLRRLVAEEKPLVTPLAHDALSARIIGHAQAALRKALMFDKWLSIG
jgi:hypothetical protein